MAEVEKPGRQKLACIKPPVISALGKTPIIGVTRPAFATGPTAGVAVTNTSTSPSQQPVNKRTAPQTIKASATVRAAADRAEQAVRSAASMSLEQIASAKKDAQRAWMAARSGSSSAKEISRLEIAFKDLQRAEAKRRAELAATRPPDRPLLAAPRAGWQLAHGNARHKTLQYEDSLVAEKMGFESTAEVPVVTENGAKGRIDHVVYLDESRRDVVITEYKTDRFDRQTEGQLARRMDEIVRQVDGYRFSEDLDAATTQTVLHIDERPTTPGFADFIEERCAEAFISVIFLDEHSPS